MNKKIAVSLVAVIVVATVASSLVFFLQRVPQPAKKVMVVEEHIELYFCLDENGDAIGRFTMKVLPSKITDFYKYLTMQIGETTIEESFKESLRGFLTTFGFEVENLELDVIAWKNFVTEASWRSPRIARWTPNGWSLSFGWVDNESAAKEIVTQREISLFLMHSVAKIYEPLIGFKEIYDVAEGHTSSKTVILLPQNSENIQSRVLETTERIDYGGGSYSVSSVTLGTIDGKSAIIENSYTFMTTEGQLTTTPEDMIENSIFYTITYGGFEPSDQTFLGSLKRVRLDLKYGIPLQENYPVFSGGATYSLSPAQVLYYSARAILAENRGQEFLITSPINVEKPENEAGDWGAYWENLSRDEYLQMAQQIVNEISPGGKAPESVDTPRGSIRFRDTLYALTRILSTYRETNSLPSTVLLAPVPSGDLDWGETVVPAKYSYYLLPDTYVITDTQRVNEILDNFPDNLDNRGLAEEICDWTASNLTYGLSFVPPTSEEVLVTKRGQCRDYTNVYLALARTAGLPARRVTGWVFSAWRPPAGWGFGSTTTPTGERIALHAWVQVYIPGVGWVPLEPQKSNTLDNLPNPPFRQLEQTWMSALAGYETARGVL